VIIVSDTSPLNYLSLIGRLELLPQLFDRVLLPPAVASEVRRGVTSNPALNAVLTAAWVEIRPLADSREADRLAHTLDRGEAEAIALSLELRLPLILIDELDGRDVAWELGMTPVGLGGVLVRAKARGLLKAVRPELDRLRNETNFRLSPKIERSLLVEAGETIQKS
jgi:predicted nucleic acid-binding protein